MDTTGIIIEHHADYTLEDITLEVATEVIIEKGDTEVSQNHQLEKEVLMEEIQGQDVINVNN